MKIPTPHGLKCIVDADGEVRPAEPSFLKVGEAYQIDIFHVALYSCSVRRETILGILGDFRLGKRHDFASEKDKGVMEEFILRECFRDAGENSLGEYLGSRKLVDASNGYFRDENVLVRGLNACQISSVQNMDDFQTRLEASRTGVFEI